MSAVPAAAAAKVRLSRTLAWTKTPVVSTVIIVALLAFVPIVWRNDYFISLLTLIFLFSIMTQSWNITIGMCGIWNFGQLAIIALGGYSAGLCVVKLGWSPWLALPVGVLAGGVSAVIMVLPSIRLRGIYASMLTFAFAEVVRLLIIADSTGFTGGPFGLPGVTGLFDWLSPSWSLRAYFWLTLTVSAAMMLVIHRMMNSPFGMGLVSLRESIRYSIGMGINRRVAFIMATAISGLIAGLAGALYVTFYHGITPSFMGLGPMGLLVIMVVVGGLGTVRGPILGAFVVTMLSELLRDTVMWRLVVQGALLLIVLAFWPAGIDGLLQRGIDKLRDWMNTGDAAEGAEAAVAVATDAPVAGAATADTVVVTPAVVSAAAVADTQGAGGAGTPGVAAPAADDPGTTTAPAAAVPEKPKKKTSRFMAWLNEDQPQTVGKADQAGNDSET